MAKDSEERLRTAIEQLGGQISVLSAMIALLINELPLHRQEHFF